MPEGTAGALVTWLPLAVLAIAWVVFMVFAGRERNRTNAINEEIRALAREQVALQREANDLLRAIGASRSPERGKN